MKKLSIIATMLMAMVTAIEANPVSPKTAQQVAENFMSLQTGRKVAMERLNLPKELDNMYLFGCKNSVGFVIIASDDRIIPILGYSTESIADETIPEPVYDWLWDNSQCISTLLNAYESSKQDSLVINRWKRLLSGLSMTESPMSTPVLPLLTTTWEQGTYYNEMCPTNSSGIRAKVGCGAVAMAQVMKYYNWPDTGVGFYSYQTPWAGTVSANFGATGYDWNNMPNTLSNTSDSIQILAVATLLFHAGVASRMIYSVSNSSTEAPSDGTLSKRCLENALKLHFKYDKTLHSVYRSSYSDSEWCDLLKSELSNGRPIIYRGTDSIQENGHIWVCDGVDANNCFHFNWGAWGTTWSSVYYSLENFLLRQPSGFTGNLNYVRRNAAVVGICPETSACSGVPFIQSFSNAHGYTSVSLASLQGGNNSSVFFMCGDTIRISAVPTDSSRFVRWSDGVIYPSREEIVDGPMTFTALFELVKGDTLYYDNGWYDFINRKIAGGRPSYWGIKVLPKSIEGHDSLRSIMIYDYYNPDTNMPTTYDAYIHIGETANVTNRVFHQQFSLNNTKKWATIPLSTPVYVDHTLPLWIIIHTNSFSRQVAPSSGNPYGFMCSNNGNDWYTPTKLYTWMVRGIFSQGDSVNVSANAEDMTTGNVLGSGRYPYGALVLLTATPQPCYSFSHWNDGNTDNPRSVTITHDTTFTAFFISASVSDTIIIRDTLTVIDTVTIHDTIINIIHDTITNTVHDTIIVTNIDSITINHYDTIYIDRTDTLFFHDTIYIHDTIYVDPNGFKDVQSVEARIFQRDGQIVVEMDEGAEPLDVQVYDVVGRPLFTRQSEDKSIRFDAPAAGVYIVRIGDYPARRVVIVR